MKFQGKLLKLDTVSDKVACWSLCKLTGGCNWFSYDKEIFYNCGLFETCHETNSDPVFLSGQKECEYDRDHDWESCE